MQVDLNSIIAKYKDLHADATYQLICHKLAVSLLEKENQELKKELAELQQTESSDSVENTEDVHILGTANEG